MVRLTISESPRRRSGGAERAAGRPERRAAQGPQSPRLRLRLAYGVGAAGSARRALATLGDDLGPALLEDLRLLVTELVTNSVRHADAPSGDTVDLELSVWPERVRVEVTDGGGGFVAPRAPAGGHELSGWGLRLVDRLASRWGIRRARGTRVWFELDRGPRLRGV